MHVKGKIEIFGESQSGTKGKTEKRKLRFSMEKFLQKYVGVSQEYTCSMECKVKNSTKLN